MFRLEIKPKLARRRRISPKDKRNVEDLSLEERKEKQERIKGLALEAKRYIKNNENI